jgi:hypothetical protein
VSHRGWLAALACVVDALVPAGCAKRLTLDRAALLASQPRTLVVAQARSPRVDAAGLAKVGDPGLVFWSGGLGAVALAGRAQVANRKRVAWMNSCGVEDPAEEMRETIADDLANTLSLHLLESDRVTAAKDPEELIDDYGGADLILDIRTAKWGIHQVNNKPSPNGLVRFAVGYEGTVRLIDARTRAVIAQGTCEIQFTNGNDPPTLAELVADDCALLDRGLTLSAATCAKRHRAALGLE